MSDSTTPPLCVADDATFWPWHPWTDFAAWADKANTVVVIPMAGLADWGIGHALDAEETVSLAVLKQASQKFEPKNKLLVIPPLRFQFGADPNCAFAILPDAAHAQLQEVCSCIAGAGFKKIVLYNSSPWSEEFCSGAGRDIRIALSVQMFAIHLSALDLDFHPVRSKSRKTLQTVITALTGHLPEPPPSPAATTRGWGDETILPLTETSLSLADAVVATPAILEAAATKLAALLKDIEARPLKIESLAYPS